MDPIHHPSEAATEPATAADSKSQATAASDRRGQRRAKTDLFVNRFLNGHPYLCRMTNISRSGARLVPIIEPRLTPAPSFMGLQFQLPGRPEVVTASGEAVTTRRRPRGGDPLHAPARERRVGDRRFGRLNRNRREGPPRDGLRRRPDCARACSAL